MVRHLLIHEDGEAVPFDLQRLPAAVGSGPHAAIDVPIPGRPVIAGYLGQNPEGHLTFEPSGVIHVIHGDCVQPAADGQAANFEHKHLLSTTVLGDGDFLRIGDHCQVDIREWGNEIHLSGQLAHKQSFAGVANTPTGPRKRHRPWWVMFLMLLLLLALAAVAGIGWFFFTSKQISIASTPAADLHLDGGWFKPKFRDGYLVRKGDYTVKGKLTGYHPLEETITVTNAPRQRFDFEFQKLPGKLSVETSPRLDLPVQINSSVVGNTPLIDHVLEPGEYQVAIFPERYFAESTNVVMEGLDKSQSITFRLTPRWSDITVSGPSGAELLVNGESNGFLPKTLELFEGNYDLTFKLPRFLDYSTNIQVAANSPVVIPTVKMQPAPATITVTSDPPGAEITLGASFKGETPVEFNVDPNRTHEIHAVKLGYTSQSKSIYVGPTERKTVHLTLAARTGLVNFQVDPPDVEVVVNGKPQGIARPMVLPALPQTIEVRKPGFAPYTKTITPRPGLPSLFVARLSPLNPSAVGGGVGSTSGVGTRPGTTTAGSATRPRATPDTLTLGNGISLKKVRPEPFVLGASRREQGRRSNETQRQVVLRRPFYIAKHEVTNKQFQQFDAGHRSGTWSGESLAGDTRPAVNMTWNKAVEYCNFLSKSEGLPEAYRQSGTSWTLVQPANSGYRLPTEAEWEFAARYKAPGDVTAKYVWGASFPPVGNVGNYAGGEANSIIANHLRNYNDGHATSATVGSFPANPLGLHDLGGNVSEWCHDGYDVVRATNPPPVDPLGIENDMLHVIRGASWKDATISTLRTAYRNYGETPKPYVGFRVARYVE